MSHKAYRFIIKNSQTRGTAQNVMLFLGNMADDEHFICWPSNKYLAQLTRMSERYIRGIIKQLIDDGEIEVVRRPQGDGKAYQITCNNRNHSATERNYSTEEEANENGTIVPRNGTIVPLKRNYSATPYIEETKGKPKETKLKKLSQKKIFAQHVKNEGRVFKNPSRENTAVDKITHDNCQAYLKTKQTLKLKHELNKPPPAKQKKAKSIRARGTRLSPQWTLLQDWFDEAVGIMSKAGVIPHGEPPDRNFIEEQAEKFKDFWIAKAGVGAVKIDWQATWRNWIRNSMGRYGNGHFTGKLRARDCEKPPLSRSFTDALSRYNANKRTLDDTMDGAFEGHPTTESRRKEDFSTTSILTEVATRH